MNMVKTKLVKLITNRLSTLKITFSDSTTQSNRWKRKFKYNQKTRSNYRLKTKAITQAVDLAHPTDLYIKHDLFFVPPGVNHIIKC